MESMRIPLALIVALAAGPALAQEVTQGELMMMQEAARRQEVEIRNQLQALDAARRADEGVRGLRAQAAGDVTTPALPPIPSYALSRVPASDMATIPDDRLKASNARVKAAANNRR